MSERDIDQADVVKTMRVGGLVEDYPDISYPSRLLLGYVGARPLHVVVAWDPKDGICVVVTVYIPSSDLWENGWTRRKSS